MLNCDKALERMSLALDAPLPLEERQELEEQVREAVKRAGYSCSLINARFAKPFDEETLLEVVKKHKLIVTMEENVKNGGLGEHITSFYNEKGSGIQIWNVAIPDEYVEHGNVSILYKEVGIDSESITAGILERMR